MNWDSLTTEAVDVLIITMNGFLVILYWLVAHLPVVLTWPVSVAVAVLLDGGVARQAGFRPRRYGRGAVQRAGNTAQWSTMALAAMWTAAGLWSPAPIPLIGLAMWLALFLTPMSIPMERDALLSRLKWMLSVYTAGVLGFLFLLHAQLSPQALLEWSRHLGQPSSGALLASAVVSSVTPYAAALLWVIGPLMYFGYIAQRFAVHSKTRVNPWKSVEARIRELRARGE